MAFGAIWTTLGLGALPRDRRRPDEPKGPTTASVHPLAEELAGAAFLAWTTTPWTLLPANVALAVNPDADYALVALTPSPLSQPRERGSKARRAKRSSWPPRW